MTFDFIIVGAGSAGCVLADRLSASGRHSVLVLEAGGSDLRFYVQMPLGYGKTFYDKTVNWLYATEPDPGLNGQRDHWPRGKVLGGSSSINAMVYIRGQKEDFESWKAAGNHGWGWDEVLAAYKAMEDVETGDAAWHGRGGPLHVTDPSHAVHPMTRDYIKSCEAVGLKHNLDFNGETQEGTGVYHTTTKGGLRLSAARAFLRPSPWLLLDEPTEGLDHATETALVAALAERLERTGQGLILVSHRAAPLTLCAVSIDVSGRL